MSRWQARWNPEPKPTEAKPYDHFTPHGGASTDMTAPQRDHPHAALLPPRGSTNFAERYPFGHAPIVFASSAPLPEPPKIFEARGLARRILSLARTMEDPLGAARRLAFRLARWGEAEAAKLREPPEIPDNTPAYEAVRQTHDLNEAKKPPPPPPP